MNRNPLLIKNFLMEKFPFIKDKTLKLYSKYLSDRKFSKAIGDGNISETLSAYTLLAKYPVDFVFDTADISPTTNFSEKEWIALGMLLRAYKEVEGINLMHLYNCFYRAEGNKITGHVVSGRTYALYSSTIWPITISFISQNGEILEDSGEMAKENSFGLKSTRISIPYNRSLSNVSPTLLTAPKTMGVDGKILESLITIELEFTGNYQPAMLVESINDKGSDYGKISTEAIGEPSKQKSLVPEILNPGEYSSKLAEFFAGTLITKQNNSYLYNSVENVVVARGEKSIEEATRGWHNVDGYIDRRIDV